MKTVEYIGIKFPIYPGPIGISLSGGADSAVLLYILMQNTQDPIIAYTWSSKEKSRQTAYHAHDVISYCIDHTGNSNIEQRTIFVDEQNPHEVFNYLVEQKNKNIVNKVYLGTTQHPPDNIAQTFNGRIDPWTYEDRRSGHTRDIEPYPYVIPFRNHNKKDIFNLYAELNLVTDLYPLTRSCENVELAQQFPKPFNEHCGVCWWCEERHWAFGKLL